MIPYYRPSHNYRELLAALSPRPARHEFESAVASRARVQYGVAFAYGRAGLVAAFKALGLTGAEIVLPAYTCLVMAHAVMASGNYPRFVDIDLADYNMDIGALRRALTPQTRAVIATHQYGYPTDVDAIRAVVGDKGIIIVEDAALGVHTLSSENGGVRGDFGLFSFGASKPLSTVEGGVMVTNSPDLYERIKAYRDSEMNQTSFKTRAKQWKRLLIGQLAFRRWIYGIWHRHRARLVDDTDLESLAPDHMPSDIAARYHDFQARVGLVQLDKLDSVLARRRALAILYDQELRDCPGVFPAPLVDNAAYAWYTVRVPGRDEGGFRQCLIDRGVGVDQSYDYVLPYLKPFRPYARGVYPHAAQAAKEVVNLPCYPHLKKAEAQYIAACVRECAREISEAL